MYATRGPESFIYPVNMIILNAFVTICIIIFLSRVLINYRIGLKIASFPLITIIISIAIPAVLSIGMNYFKFDEDFADLLLPPQSRIFADRDWVEKHVPYEQRPIRLILKNENVLTRKSLLAVRKQPSVNVCGMLLKSEHAA